MRQRRWLAAGLGFGLLLTTAASTTYAQSNTPQSFTQQNNSFLCFWLPWLPSCGTGGGGTGGGGTGGGPSLAATPELDSLLLFGFGLSGLGGYAVSRYRARRRT